ncbi:hypothetical protein C2U72_14595, partial [Prosthecomicrobium hirschii]
MHTVSIPQSVVDRVVARRGAAHPFADLDPARTALVVVDLQNGFMMDGVGHAVCPTAREIVPNVNRLAAAVRGTGGKVFWIRNTHYDECFTSWSILHDYTVPDKRAHRIRSMSEDTLGNELWADLDVKPEDDIVRKTRFSAFIQ